MHNQNDNIDDGDGHTMGFPSQHKVFTHFHLFWLSRHESYHLMLVHLTIIAICCMDENVCYIDENAFNSEEYPLKMNTNHSAFEFDFRRACL